MEMISVSKMRKAVGRAQASKEYAEAFLSAAKGKNTAEQKHLIHVLVQVVIRRGEQKLLPHIRREIILSLEKEGKISQIGTFGRDVEYKLK